MVEAAGWSRAHDGAASPRGRRRRICHADRSSVSGQDLLVYIANCKYLPCLSWTRMPIDTMSSLSSSWRRCCSSLLFVRPLGGARTAAGTQAYGVGATCGVGTYSTSGYCAYADFRSACQCFCTSNTAGECKTYSYITINSCSHKIVIQLLRLMLIAVLQLSTRAVGRGRLSFENTRVERRLRECNGFIANIVIELSYLL